MPASKTVLLNLNANIGKGQPKAPRVQPIERRAAMRQSRFTPPPIAADPYIKASDIRRAAWRTANDDLGLVPDELHDLAMRIYNLESEVRQLSREYDSKCLAVEVRISEERRDAWKVQQAEIRAAKMERLENAKAKLAGRKKRRTVGFTAEKTAELFAQFAAHLREQGVDVDSLKTHLPNSPTK